MKNYSENELASLLGNKTPSGVWKNENNLKNLASLIIKDLFKNATDCDLYNLTEKKILESKYGKFFSSAFFSSPRKLALYANPDLCIFKFKTVPVGTWRGRDNVKKAAVMCLEELVGENPIDEMLYSLTQKQIQNSGWGGLLKNFNGSPLRLVMFVYPHLVKYKFKNLPKGVWKCGSAVKKATVLCLKELVGGNPSDRQLYSVSKKSIKNIGYLSLFIKVYRYSVIALVTSVYPHLNKFKFKYQPSGVWQNKNNLKEAAELCVEELVGRTPTDEQLYCITSRDLRRDWGGLFFNFGQSPSKLVMSVYPHLEKSNFIRFKSERKVKMLSEKYLKTKCDSHGDFYHKDFKSQRLKPDVYFKNLKLAIEYHGRQHYEYVEHIHINGEIDIIKQQKRDQKLRDYCKEIGVYLIEISHFDHKKIPIEKIIINRLKQWEAEFR